MKSVIQSDETCLMCGRNGNGDSLEEHHIFFGQPNRDYSEKDGMKVLLCGCRCHREGPNAAHRNRNTDLRLKRIAQVEWQHRYGDTDAFIRRYGRSYL